MTPRTRTVLGRGAVAVLAAGTAVTLSAGPALAEVAPVVNTETVKVEMSPTGKVRTARLYSQLSTAGEGKVTIEDPTATKGLRNLDGFAAPTVKDGVARYDLTVDGRTNQRTVATFDRRLPITVGVTYLLDGRPVGPDEIVGRSGVLEVQYQVENVTARPTDVTFKDGNGKPVTEKVDLTTPLVGQLTTTLPDTFTSVEAPRAGVAGDGRGGTLLNWSLVLFEPVGQPVQKFGWKAVIDGGQVPAAKVQVVPVAPKANPQLRASQDSAKRTASTAGQLTGAVTYIDGNLLKLQNGAGELLDGLNQLAAGAAELSSGLGDEAAPGAGQLAAGLSDAEAGAKQISAGFNSKAGKDLVGGSSQLADGLKRISGGLNALADKEGLPSAYAGAVALRAGVDEILAGLGSSNRDGTILNGLAQLEAGNGQLQDGVAALRTGASGLVGPSGLPAAKGGVDQVKAGIDDGLKAGGSIDQLKGGVTAARSTAGCAGDPVCVGTLTQVSAGIDQLRASSGQASAGLGQVSGGLGQAIAGIGTGDSPGASTLRGGLNQVAGGLAASGAGMDQLDAGLRQIKAGLRSGSSSNPGIAEGLDKLVSGLTAAVAGIGQLASGAQEASTGSTDLKNGIARAGAGSGQLTTGLGLLRAGAQELHAGVLAAADGAGQISAGADEAAGGAGRIEEGTGLIRTLGTSALIDAGNTSTKTAGKIAATLEALNTRAATDALPYGVPAGATGSGAYVFELASATTERSQNTARGIAAIGLFVIAGVAGALIRRRFVS